MKVRDLIQELLPFKDLDLVIVDNCENLISKDIRVCLTPDYLVENRLNKHITAIPSVDDNITGEVAYIRTEDFTIDSAALSDVCGMENPFYTLIVYKDSSKEKDITNIYELKVFQTLDEAKEQLLDDDCKGMTWDISEDYEWKITDLSNSEEDELVEDNVIYRPLADIEDWPTYDWSCRTLGEAKRRALECVEKEHCDVYIEKSKRTVILSGTT